MCLQMQLGFGNVKDEGKSRMRKATFYRYSVTHSIWLALSIKRNTGER